MAAVDAIEVDFCSRQLARLKSLAVAFHYVYECLHITIFDMLLPLKFGLLGARVLKLSIRTLGVVKIVEKIVSD